MAQSLHLQLAMNPLPKPTSTWQLVSIPIKIYKIPIKYLQKTMVLFVMAK